MKFGRLKISDWIKYPFLRDNYRVESYYAREIISEEKGYSGEIAMVCPDETFWELRFDNSEFENMFYVAHNPLQIKFKTLEDGQKYVDDTLIKLEKLKMFL
jgi:hypothetical protein